MSMPDVTIDLPHTPEQKAELAIALMREYGIPQALVAAEVDALLRIPAAVVEVNAWRREMNLPPEDYEGTVRKLVGLCIYRWQRDFRPAPGTRLN